MTTEQPLLLTISAGLNGYANLEGTDNIAPLDLDEMISVGKGDIMCRFNWRNTERQVSFDLSKECTKLRLPYRPETDRPNLSLRFYDTRSKLNVNLVRSEASSEGLDQWFQLSDAGKSGRIGVRIAPEVVTSLSKATPFPAMKEPSTPITGDRRYAEFGAADDLSPHLPKDFIHNHQNLNRTEILARHHETPNQFVVDDLVFGPDDSTRPNTKGQRPSLNSSTVPHINGSDRKTAHPNAVGGHQIGAPPSSETAKMGMEGSDDVAVDGSHDVRSGAGRHVGAHTRFRIIGDHEKAFDGLDDLVSSFKDAIQESTGIDKRRVGVGRLNNEDGTAN